MKPNKSSSLRKTDARLIAVIDIGSNSVRLVIYRGLKRTPDIIFNERVMSGLGVGVSTTGEMTGEAMNSALNALERFAVLCRDMKVDEIDAVATSAVRDAKNGPWLVREIQKRCKFKVNVISGREEARLSAYGILSGFPNAEGLVGDLGGGSLELIQLEEGERKKKISLPIGPVRVLDGAEGFGDEHKRFIQEELAKVDWIKELEGKPFYMVGGAWRALAHLHIFETNWPLHVLHGYSISPETCKSFCWEIERKSLSRLKGIDAIPSKRLATLPLAARILREIIRIGKPSKIITSGYGIREGVMFKKLNHAMRAQDPLIETSKEFGRTMARFPKHGDKLIKWTDGLFPNQEQDKRRIREAICHLSEISHTSHPDFKAQLAFDRSIVGRFVGVSHKERALISLGLYASYGGEQDSKTILPATKILNRGEIKEAIGIGLLVQFAQKFTGGTDRPLKKTRLFQEDKKLVLEIRQKDAVLISKSVSQRFAGVASLFGLEPDIRVI